MEYRLNKYISGSGYCSRREADRFIEDGQVTIDGKRASIGMRVMPGQKVKVCGELIVNEHEPIYIAFNNPVGIVSTTDTNEKNNIVEYISHEQRIFPIGRLDKDSQGLILLTNDGDIVNKILRVGNNHKKEYIVKVNKPITKEFLTKMAQGVPILDRVTRRCEIVEINPYTFQISLVQGLNRQIRRMCEYFDYDVVKLERIQIMNIKLGGLGQGSWRNLTGSELEGLFDLLEDSDVGTQTKKPANSNKGMNRALEAYDIKTNYRKASSVANLAKSTRSDKTSTNSDKSSVKSAKTPYKPVEAVGKKKPSRKKEGGGPRVGKSRVAPKGAASKSATSKSAPSKSAPSKQRSPLKKTR